VTTRNVLNATGWAVSCGFQKTARPQEFNVQQITAKQAALLQNLVQLHVLDLKILETWFS
jgi:hypothetical protein